MEREIQNWENFLKIFDSEMEKLEEIHKISPILAFLSLHWITDNLLRFVIDVYKNEQVVQEYFEELNRAKEKRNIRKRRVTIKDLRFGQVQELIGKIIIWLVSEKDKDVDQLHKILEDKNEFLESLNFSRNNVVHLWNLISADKWEEFEEFQKYISSLKNFNVVRRELEDLFEGIACIMDIKTCISTS